MTKTLAELKEANLPVATCDSIGLGITPKGDGLQSDADKTIATINKYLTAFCAPANLEKSVCPSCDKELNGLLGSFTWGIATGEGFCAACGYLCRAHHRPQSESGEPIFNQPLVIVLAYHPSVLQQEPTNGQ